MPSQETDPVSRPLAGQIAVVTGGGRGIGYAIALRLARMGTKVVVCGRTKKHLQNASDHIRMDGYVCETLEMNVASVESVETAAKTITDRYGICRILVNNAGIRGPDALLHEVSPEEFDALMATNLRGVYLCMRAFVPGMIQNGGGDIVNISSSAGRNPLPRGAAYSASKWAVNGLSYGVAEELRNFGIRVSVVCPGSTNSNMDHPGKNPEKMLQPENVADVVALLVSQPKHAFIRDVVLTPAVKP